MAQTKTPTKKTKAKRSSSAAGSKAKPSARSKSKARSKPTRSRSKASAPASRAGSTGDSPTQTVTEGIKSARETVGDAGQKAANATGKAATATGKAVSHAKVPLIAGGAALVGAASGMAINAARSKDSKVLGVKVPKTKVKIKSKDLAQAADRVASAGEQIGRLSHGIRELQGTDGAESGNGHHRSPIEVVVDSLTRRH